jgi:hypothetical protein
MPLTARPLALGFSARKTAQRRSRHVALDHVARHLGGVTRGQVGGNAEPALHATDIGNVPDFDREAGLALRA